MKQPAAVQAEDPPRASVLWQKVEAAVLDRAPLVAFRNGSHDQYNPRFGFLLGQVWVK